MVQRHAQESSMLGGQHHVQREHHARGGGLLAGEQQAHIAQGEQYAAWGEQNSEREQYARGGEQHAQDSMLGGAA